MCNEVQNVGAIDFAFRGSKMEVMPAFQRAYCKHQLHRVRTMLGCVPTGAIVVKNDTQKVWNALSDPNTKGYRADCARRACGHWPGLGRQDWGKYHGADCGCAA